MRMSMELMTRKHKQQNSSLFVWLLFVNIPQASGPKYSIWCKMQRFLTAFRERSVTDINNKRDAQMLWTNVAKVWAKLEMVKQNLSSYLVCS